MLVFRVSYNVLLDVISSHFHFTFAVLSLPNSTRSKVRPFCKHLAPWSQTEQPTPQRQLWSQDWGFRACKDNVRDWFHDGVRRHSLVQGTRIAPKLLGVHGCNRYLVRRLHTRRNHDKKTSFSWQRLCSSIETYYRGIYFHINFFIFSFVCETDAISFSSVLWKLIGSPDDASLGFLRSDNARRYVRQLPQYVKQQFSSRFPNTSSRALDLLEKMLVFDPSKRITGMVLVLEFSIFEFLFSLMVVLSLRYDRMQWKRLSAIRTWRPYTTSTRSPSAPALSSSTSSCLRSPKITSKSSYGESPWNSTPTRQLTEGRLGASNVCRKHVSNNVSSDRREENEQ